MRNKRFEEILGALELEKALTKAKCPEDFFGITPDVDISTLIEKRTQEFESVTGEASEGVDGNADDRLRGLKRIFPLMLKWANEKVASNEYGNMKTYRAKIVFVVKDHEGCKLFHLEGVTDICLCTESINALSFEGYDRMDRVTIRKGEQTISGRVNYYGTHGAQEMFLLNSEAHVPCLEADDYEVGDTVEIETVSYASIDEYAGFLIRMDVENLPPEVERVIDKMMGEQKEWDESRITQAWRDSSSSKVIIL